MSFVSNLTDQEDPDEKRSLTIQAIKELPTANRDTLAFLMVHLHHISQSAATKMSTSNLARVFGPTIVGHSMIDAPSAARMAEVPKQVQVMEGFFKINEEFWNKIVSPPPSFSPTRKRP